MTYIVYISEIGHTFMKIIAVEKNAKIGRTRIIGSLSFFFKY